MSAQFIVRLTLALSVALMGACGEDSVDQDKDVDNVDGDDDVGDDDDDDVPDEPADDDETPVDPVEDDDDDSQPAAMRDSGVAMPVRDSGGPARPAGDAGAIDGGTRDSGAATNGDAGGSTTDPVEDSGMSTGGSGECCSDGKCICRTAPPSSLSSTRGPYMTMSYNVAGAGCVYYPTGVEGPFAAVAISDGFGGTGGCGRTQTDGWGPLYASWGIVTMIVNTGSGDQPNQRGRALTRGIEAFKAENMRSGSPLSGKLAGRYGTSGFSMGGGGTSYASVQDKTLLTSVAIMPWGPVRSGVTVPTLVICGSSDAIASCSSHGNPLYNGITGMVPKMKTTVSSGHVGQPSAGSGRSGQAGLAFQKVFLEGDTRWKPLLQMVMGEKANIN